MGQLIDDLGILTPGQRTKKYEGWREKQYLDSRGIPTIGYGFNLREPAIRKRIPIDVLQGRRGLTQQEAEPIFQEIYGQAQNTAKGFVGPDIYNKLDPERREILNDMAYNLGQTRLGGFKKFREALIQGDYDRAAGEMLNSQWYKQTGNRSKELTELMRAVKKQGMDLSALNPFKVEEAQAATLQPAGRLVDDLGILTPAIAGNSLKTPVEQAKTTEKPRLVDDLGIFGESGNPLVKTGKELLKPFINPPPLLKEAANTMPVKEAMRGARDLAVASPQAVGSLVMELGERMGEAPDMNKFNASFPWLQAGKLAMSETLKNSEVDENVARLGKGIIDDNKKWIDANIAQYGPSGEAVKDLFYNLGSGSVTLATALGLSAVTKNPAAASALFGIYQNANLYQEGREKGLSPQQAGDVSTIGGAVEGGLEYLGLDFFLKKYGGPVFSAMIRAGSEGAQEWLQQTGENVVVKLGGIDPARKIFEGSGQAALVGVLLGAPASVSVTMAERAGVIDQLQEFGLTYEQAKQFASDVIKAQRNEVLKVLQDETGAIGGRKAKGFEEAPGKFSSLMDKKERFEIDDSKAKYVGGEKGTSFSTVFDSIYQTKPEGNKFVFLPDVFKHEGLYEQYPELKEIKVYPSMDEPKGSFQNGSIFINKNLAASETKDTLLHEIQHWIQEKEKFARGGNPKDYEWNQQVIDELRNRLKFQTAMLRRAESSGGIDPVTGQSVAELKPLVSATAKELIPYQSVNRPYDKYRRLAGEIEARDVADRKDLTAEQRTETPPYTRQGIPLKDAIVRMESGNAASVEKQPWEMTRDEYRESQRKGSEVLSLSVGRFHRESVQKAISEGKPVPAEVLKDYPELQKQSEIPATDSGKKYLATPDNPLKAEFLKWAKLRLEDDFSGFKLSTYTDGEPYFKLGTTEISLRDYIEARNTVEKLVKKKNLTDKEKAVLEANIKYFPELRNSSKTGPQIEQIRTEPEVMTEEQYLSSKGATFMAGAEPALHRTPGGLPKGVREKYLAEVQRKMSENNDQREKLRKEYAEKVASGEIRPPTRIERLMATASGDEILESVQAARRVLEKQGIDWKTGKPIQQAAEPPQKPPAKPPVAEAAASPEPENKPLSPGKVKPLINKSTGVRKQVDDIIQKENIALKRKLAAEVKGSKEGFKAGKAEANKKIAQIREQLAKAKTEEEKKNLRIKLAAEVRAARIGYLAGRKEARAEILKELQKKDYVTSTVKSLIVEYAKQNLSPAERGKMLTVVSNAKTPQQRIKAFFRIDNMAEENHKKELVREIKEKIKALVDAPGVAVEYRHRIKEFFQKYDFTKRSQATLDRYKKIQDYIKREMAAGRETAIPERITEKLKSLVKKPISELTVKELEVLSGEIDLLEQLGRTKLRARKALYEAEKEAIKAEVTTGATNLDRWIEKQPAVGEKLSWQDRLKNWMTRKLNEAQRMDLAIAPMDVIYDVLDGSKGTYDGANHRNFKAKTDVNFGRFLDLKYSFQKPLEELSNKLKLNEKNFERIGVHAARMQKNGMEKLLASGLTEKEINIIRLNEAEMEWYRAARKALDELRPKIAEILKNVYNEELGQVENYFSFMTDWKAMDEAEVFQRVGDRAEEYGMPTKNPNMDFSKTRVGGRQKIKLNAYEIFMRHTDNAAYLVTMARDNRMLFEIANSPEYREAVGARGQKIVLEWMDTISRKGGLAGQKQIQMLDALRKNIGVGVLGFKLSTILIQPTALIDAGTYIGTYNIRGAHNIIDKDWRKFVLQFPELRERVGDDPAMLAFLQGDSLFAKLQRAGMQGILVADKITTMATVAGAYEKYMNENGLEIDFDNINPEAMKYAQLVMRRTQSTGLFKDTPQAISRGTFTNNRSADRMIFLFQNFLLNRWSVIRHDAWRSGIRQNDPSKAAGIMIWLVLATLASTGLRLGQRWARDLIAGKRDDENENEFLKTFAMEAVQNVPFLGPTVSALAYGSMPHPAIQTLAQVFEGGETVLKGKKATTKIKGGIRMAEAAGKLSGIPGSTEVSGIARGMVGNKSKKKSSEPWVLSDSNASGKSLPW